MTRAAHLVAVALATLPAPVLAQSSDVLLNCSACHAIAPDRPAAARAFPDLNGQPVRYLERQLEAFRTGDRQHRQMELTAHALGAGHGAMARMYADAPRPDFTRDAQGATPELVMQGDWERGLPPCASCHSLDPDQDRARTSPRLHGQPETYLADQLHAYADGSRTSDPMGRMRAFAGRLGAEEIADLAAYYAAWEISEDNDE
jgi:cytochrome c553